MKRPISILVMLIMVSVSVILNSCKKEEAPVELTLSALTANEADLNQATPATNVALDVVIKAIFSTNVDASTATTANITLNRNYDDSVIDISISVSGDTIIIKPGSSLGTGTQYTLTFGTGLKSTAGKVLASSQNRSFTTLGTFAVPGAIAQYTFEDNANDITGNYDPASNGIIDVTYVAGRNNASGKAASFNGTTSLIEIPNGDLLENTDDFTLSFWVMADSSRHDQFVMGLAGWYGFQFEINSNGNGGLGECKLAAQYSLSDGTSASQDLWFNGGSSGTTKDNGGWQGWTYCKDLTSNNGTGVNGLLSMNWAHVVCVYNHATKIGTMYINGVKMKEQDFNLYGTTHPLYNATGLKYAGNAGNNSFVFGFIQDKTDPTITDSWADYTVTTNNHFKGLLDDVIIYHKVLTADEIALMYNSGK